MSKQHRAENYIYLNLEILPGNSFSVAALRTKSMILFSFEQGEGMAAM